MGAAGAPYKYIGPKFLKNVNYIYRLHHVEYDCAGRERCRNYTYPTNIF